MKRLNIIQVENYILSERDMNDITGGGPGFWCPCMILPDGGNLPTASPNGADPGNPGGGQPGNPDGCNIITPCMILPDGGDQPTAFIGK